MTHEGVTASDAAELPKAPELELVSDHARTDILSVLVRAGYTSSASFYERTVVYEIDDPEGRRRSYQVLCRFGNGVEELVELVGHTPNLQKAIEYGLTGDGVVCQVDDISHPAELTDPDEEVEHDPVTWRVDAPRSNRQPEQQREPRPVMPPQRFTDRLGRGAAEDEALRSAQRAIFADLDYDPR